jgi:hypothetical protein
MKRSIAPLVALIVMILGPAAWGYVGYDDTYAPPGVTVPSTFTFAFEETTSPVTVYDTASFARADGWDFGDREGYQCGLLELFDGTDLKLLGEYEINEDYDPSGPSVFRVNDENGLENNDGANPVPFPNPIPSEYGAIGSAKGGFDVCGAGPGQGSWESSGEDHFPHYAESHIDHAPLQIYQDDEVWRELPDLVNEDCDNAYWSPGDEQKEIVLWWDEDGPTHAQEGEPLDCPGSGSGEPIAVMRFFVKYMDPDIGVCIHDDDAPGDHVCSGNTP